MKIGLCLGGGGALIGHKGVDRLMAAHLPEDFSDLKVPLAVTALDQVWPEKKNPQITEE